MFGESGQLHISHEQVREVVGRTIHSKPLKATHWRVRTIARATGLSPGDGPASLEGARPPAPPGEGLQTFTRPALPRKAQRRGRALPGPAGEGDRLQRGREESDPSTRPRRASSSRSGASHSSQAGPARLAFAFAAGDAPPQAAAGLDRSSLQTWPAAPPHLPGVDCAAFLAEGPGVGAY